jgi:ATP-dependent Clp protease ATP-binding subunit ClpA
VSEIVIAGAVAGAIAGAIIGAAVLAGSWVISRRPTSSQGQPWQMRSATTHLYGRPEGPAAPGHAPTQMRAGHRGPFDRFNDRAKRVLALAQDEAIRFNHNYIGTEHLLLGLVREGEGVAARVLSSLGVDLSKVRTAVEFMAGRGDATTSPSEITLSPRTKRAIELAVAEVEKMGQTHVGTEHLLLGILAEGEGMASGILQSLGVSFEQVRQRVVATISQQGTKMDQAAPDARGGGPFDRLDSGSKRTLALAQDEAARLGHNWIGTEHLMLAFVRDAGRAHDALASLGVELQEARIAVEKVVPRVAATPRELTLTPRMHQLFGKAIGMSRANHRSEITPVLLLLALIDDTDAVGTQVLTQLGATPDKIRAALAEPPSGPSAHA